MGVIDIKVNHIETADEVVREAQLLELHGFLVADARNGEEALEQLTSDPEGYALILRQLYGPTIAGWRLGVVMLFAMAGMAVAMKDLEIRGSGNLLGGEQSGHIADVGFDLYVRLVGEAVAEFKGEAKEVPSLTPGVGGVPPDARQPHERLHIPRKLAAMLSDDLLVSAWRFAESAANARMLAISSGNLTTAWEASSAAAGRSRRRTGSRCS